MAHTPRSELPMTGKERLLAQMLAALTHDMIHLDIALLAQRMLARERVFKDFFSADSESDADST